MESDPIALAVQDYGAEAMWPNRVFGQQYLAAIGDDCRFGSVEPAVAVEVYQGPMVAGLFDVGLINATSHGRVAARQQGEQHTRKILF
jgi:hypothetical protein